MMKFDIPPSRAIHPFAGPDFSAAAAKSIAEVERVGAAHYDRTRHLPRLIPMTPGELADERPQARRTVLARLARALRAERNRGRAGHWTYDLNRHVGLRQAYVAEREELGLAQK